MAASARAIGTRRSGAGSARPGAAATPLPLRLLEVRVVATVLSAGYVPVAGPLPRATARVDWSSRAARRPIRQRACWELPQVDGGDCPATSKLPTGGRNPASQRIRET